jgi:hypothetical protein
MELTALAVENVTQMAQISGAADIRAAINSAQPLSPLFGGGLYRTAQLSYLA